MVCPAFARPGQSQTSPKPRVRVVPTEGRTRHVDAHAGPTHHVAAHAGAHRGAGSPGRRDRRALGSPRCGDRPPAQPHPRVRRARGLEHGLPLVRGLAVLARGARPGRRAAAGPSGARPRHAAGPGRGAGAWRALLRQGPRLDPSGDPGDGGPPAHGGARGHGGPRRADRAGLASRRPAGRSAGSGAPARGTRAARLPG